MEQRRSKEPSCCLLVLVPPTLSLIHTIHSPLTACCLDRTRQNQNQCSGLMKYYFGFPHNVGVLDVNDSTIIPLLDTVTFGSMYHHGSKIPQIVNNSSRSMLLLLVRLLNSSYLLQI